MLSDTGSSNEIGKQQETVSKKNDWQCITPTDKQLADILANQLLVKLSRVSTEHSDQKMAGPSTCNSQKRTPSATPIGDTKGTSNVLFEEQPPIVAKEVQVAGKEKEKAMDECASENSQSSDNEKVDMETVTPPESTSRTQPLKSTRDRFGNPDFEKSPPLEASSTKSGLARDMSPDPGGDGCAVLAETKKDQKQRIKAPETPLAETSHLMREEDAPKELHTTSGEAERVNKT